MVYQLFALVILAGFYACYFGKMLSQRRRGIRTDQMGRGKTGRVRAIEIAVKCVTALLPIEQVVCIALKRTALPDWTRILGALLGALGVAAFAAAGVIGMFIPFVAHFFAFQLPGGKGLLALGVQIVIATLLFALSVWLFPKFLPKAMRSIISQYKRISKR